jgi:hypothetical protein
VSPRKKKGVGDAIQEEIERRAEQRRAGVARVLETVLDLQEEIQKTLAATPSDFDSARLPQLLGELDRVVERWTGKVDAATSPFWGAAAELGPQMVDGPLRLGGIRIGEPLITDSLIETLTGYAPDKVKGITADAKAAIGKQVRLGVLGGKSPHEVMKAVGETLDGPGPFRFVKFRAEMVVRTEMGRIHSEAGDLRLVQGARVVDGLKKEWRWSGKSRATHRAIDKTVREVEQTWSVGGEEMRHPRQAGASAENVVGCGCESVPWKADWT